MSAGKRTTGSHAYGNIVSFVHLKTGKLRQIRKNLHDRQNGTSGGDRTWFSAGSGPRRSALAVSPGAADRDIYQFSGKRNTEDLRRRALLAGGVVLVLFVTGTTAVVSGGILYACGRISPGLKFLVSVILCYQLFAVRSLKDESMKVYRELKKDDLPAARYAVSMIVGRDTERLDMTGVTKAAVETVAENTSDGVAAPLFYMTLGGPVLGWIYKAVNTMDSMVGYKNDKYFYLGRAAAKLDDLLNFIPARLCAWVMIFASYLPSKDHEFDGSHAKEIFLRDRFNHASPNSAQTESVCAGSLRIRLAGDAWYFGKLVKKKYIGDDLRPVEIEDIPRANKLLYRTSWTLMGLCAVVETVLNLL